MTNAWILANPERQKANIKRHYEANKADWKVRKIQNRVAVKALVDAAKDVPCMDCGVKYPSYVMDLDHRDPTTKLYHPAKMAGNVSLKTAATEIAKCDPVCANCHRIRTYSKECTVASGEAASLSS